MHVSSIIHVLYWYHMKRKILKGILAVFIIAFVGLTIFLLLQKPSHDRDWEIGHEELPHIVIEGDDITIENLRDFEWTGPFSAEPNYITESYKLSDVDKAEVIISHFDEFEGMAHIFLNFGFTDGRHVNISLETRRESDEKFSPVLGLLRQFEIIYVVGTDRDLIGVRTGHRNERVYVYPAVVSSPEKVREMFLLLAGDINAIYEKPRFYNTLTHNCTNELTRRVEDISELNFPFTYKTLFPGFFDEILYNMGLIDTSKPFEEVKQAALLDNTVLDETSPDFSAQVRNKD
jgi:hypothetical protein